MITVEDIKNALEAGFLPIQSNVIKTEILKARDGRDVECELHYGWDVAKCYAIDSEWGPFNVRLMGWVESQNFDNERLNEVLDNIQMDDGHWEWFVKACAHIANEFHWFFVMAENKQQAACLIYHPKQSPIDGVEIFYIEYIAVAPWNRENPMEERIFAGLGSWLVKSIIEYVTKTLNFGHGFSLHALPRASGFYIKIGMQRYPDLDKGILQYYEMPEKIASAYMVSK